MKIKCFLIVNARGTVRATKNLPDLSADEVSVGVNLQIPDALFRRPRIEATLVVSEQSVAPPVIEAETLDVIRQAIETGTGLDVRLSIAEAPGEE